MTMQEVVETLLKGKWIILASFVLVLGVTAVYTARQDPEYVSATTLYVNSQQSNPQLGELLGLESGRRNVMNEIEILRSRAIAMRVAERMLDTRYVPGTDEPLSVLATPEGAPLPSTLEVAQRLRRRIAVRPVSREVDIIELSATSTVPEEAALIANLYAQEFVSFNRSSSRARMSASREFLGDVTARTDSMLNEAEQNIMQFAQQQGVVAPDQEAQQLLESMSQLQAQESQMLFELRAAQAERQALEAELNEIVPGLSRALTSNQSQVIDGLLKRIAQLQMEIEEKLSKNPGLRGRESQDSELSQKQRQIAELQEQLNIRMDNLAEGALNSKVWQGSGDLLQVVGDLRSQMLAKEIEISGIRARLEVLGQSLTAFQRELNTIPYKSIVLARLRREVETSEQLFTVLTQKLQEARIAEQSELGYIDIIDHAIVSSRPVRPRIQANLLIGSFLGLVLGVGMAFLRTAMDNRVRRPEDLRQRGYSMLGTVPDMRRVIRKDFQGKERLTVDGHDYSTSLIALLNPLSPTAESYRRLRTNIQFSRPDKPVQAIAVTSPGPGEGKTVSSMNLAITMAQAGRRTIYVDADLRRPAGHSMLGVPREPGLVDLLFDSSLHRLENFATGIDDFYMVPTGSSVPNPAEILGSKRMHDFIAQLRDEFEVIVIDTPPVLAVADAMLIARQCDGVVLVCSAGETSYPGLDHASDTLRDVGAKIIGVVLNRFSPKASYGGYGYGYGYGYGNEQYYGEKPVSSKVSEQA